VGLSKFLSKSHPFRKFDKADRATNADRLFFFRPQKTRFAKRAVLCLPFPTSVILMLNKCPDCPYQKSSGFCLSSQLLFSSHFFRKANHLLLTLPHVTRGNANLQSTPARTTRCAAPEGDVQAGFASSPAAATVVEVVGKRCVKLVWYKMAATSPVIGISTVLTAVTIIITDTTITVVRRVVVSADHTRQNVPPNRLKPVALAAGAPAMIPATAGAGADALGVPVSPRPLALKPMGWKETTTATIRLANRGLTGV